MKRIIEHIAFKTGLSEKEVEEALDEYVGKLIQIQMEEHQGDFKHVWIPD